MRKTINILLCILLVIIFFQNNLYSQWKKIENIPKEYNNSYYYDVFFLPSNPNYGWISGKDGKILRTTDRGNTWIGSTIYSVNQDSTHFERRYQLESIIFLDKNVGYCVDASRNKDDINSESKIFKSIDGGISWTDISPKGETTNIFWGTYFISSDVGLLLGGSSCQANYPSHFYMTTDGGKSWKKRSYLPPFPTKLADAILFDESGKGFAISSGLLWESNGDNKWEIKERTGSNNWHEELTYFNGSILIPTSEGCSGSTTVENGTGDIRMKTKYDKDWKIFPTEFPMFGSFLIDETHGWAVGMDRSVFYTEDGGLTWNARHCGIEPTSHLDDIWFINENEGWLVGTGIYKYSPVVNDTPYLKLNLPICEDEFTFAKLDTTADLIEWYINDKLVFWDIDSITVKAGDSVQVYMEKWHKPYCGWTDKYYIEYNKSPEFSISPKDTIYICNNQEKILSVNEKFEYYLWSTGDTTQQITIDEPGIYSVTVFDSIGCNTERKIEVFQAPRTEYHIKTIGKTNICKNDSVKFIITGKDISYKWYEEKDDSTNIFISDKDTVLITESKKIFVEIYNKYDCIEKSKYYYIIVRNDSNRFEYYFSSNEQNEKIGNIRYPNIICKNLTINNTTNQTQSLTSAFFKKNISFSVPPGQLPVEITPKNSFELLICFTGKKIEIQKDTLIISDKCINHIIPLIANTFAGNYNGTSNCEIKIDAETIDIDHSFIPFFATPYPNPTSDKISISGIGKKAILENTNFELYDYIGNKYNISPYSIEYNENSCQYTIYLDVPNGLYLLKMINGKYVYYNQIIKIN